MSILVTGASGFMGSHLVDYLVNKGYYVFGVDDMSGGYWRNIHPKSTFIELDLPLARMERFRRFFQRKQSGSVERGHVAQAQYHDRRKGMQIFRHHRNLVGRAKQEWSVDAEDRSVVGDIVIL